MGESGNVFGMLWKAEIIQREQEFRRPSANIKIIDEKCKEANKK